MDNLESLTAPKSGRSAASHYFALQNEIRLQAILAVLEPAPNAASPQPPSQQPAAAAAATATAADAKAGGRGRKKGGAAAASAAAADSASAAAATDSEFKTRISNARALLSSDQWNVSEFDQPTVSVELRNDMKSKKAIRSQLRASCDKYLSDYERSAGDANRLSDESKAFRQSHTWDGFQSHVRLAFSECIRQAASEASLINQTNANGSYLEFLAHEMVSVRLPVC